MKALTFLILVVIFNLINLTNLKAQVSEEWVARYSGPGNNLDDAYSIAVDGSGNVYITGTSEGSGTANDYATIKYNSSGVQQWVERYDGPGNFGDIATSIAVDGLGNVYVTGISVGSGTEYDYATIKYNSSGVQQWIQRYNGPGNTNDGASSIAVDGSGNVYVTGGSFSISIGSINAYATIKYDSTGVQQWIQKYSGPGNASDGASSMEVDGSGNVYVTGISFGIGTDYDYATIKYNSSGVQQWVQRYHGPYEDDFAYSLAIDGSGNVYVTGSSERSAYNVDYATIKYNSSGVQQWVQRYNGPGDSHDATSSIAIDDSGNIYVTGSSYGNGTLSDYATIKYNSSGVQQWIQRYNGPEKGYEDAVALAIDGSGNIYVTGSSTGSGTSEDYVTIKYNSSGVQQWIQRYNGSGNGTDAAHSLAVDSSGNVYVTGFSNGIGTGLDYVTIKYSQKVGIDPISNEIPKEYILSQNYPNPFNPITKIKFDITRDVRRETQDVRLIVYNVLGKEVATLVNAKLSPGSYQAEFDGSNFSSGIYFYKLNAGNFSEVKRMILLK